MQKKKKNGVRLPSKKKLAELAKIAHGAEETDSLLGEKMPTDEVLEYYKIDPRKPETYKEEIIEFVRGEFVLGGFPGFEEGVKRVGKILEEYGISPVSRAGQHVLNEYVTEALEEEFGDFEHSVPCGKCGTEFEPSHSLEYANNILKGKAFCPACKK